MAGVAIISTGAYTAFAADIGSVFPTPAGRRVEILTAGSLLPVAAFRDAAMTIPLAQPILTDADGAVPGYVASSSVAILDVASGLVFQAGGSGGGGGGGSAPVTASETDGVTLTDDHTWLEVTGVSVSVTAGADGVVTAVATAQWEYDLSNYQFGAWAIALDGAVGVAYEDTTRDSSADTTDNIYTTTTIHETFTGVSAGAHTVALYWNGLGASNEVTVMLARITATGY